MCVTNSSSNNNNALFSLLFSFVAIMIECAALPFDMSCALFVRDAQQLLSLMSLAVGIGLIIRVVLLMASCLAAINSIACEQVVDGVDSFSDRLDVVSSETCAEALAERLRVAYEAEHGLAPAPAVLYAKTGLTTSAVGLVYAKHVC